MKYILKVIKGNNFNSIYEIFDGELYEIRRASKYSEKNKRVIYVDDEEVSKLHAKIFMTRGELVIHDLSSTNGIFINSKKIDKSLLYSNDVLKIGDTEFKIIKEDNKDELTFLRKKNKYNKLTKKFKDFVKLSDEDYKFIPDISKLEIQSTSNDLKNISDEIKKILIDADGIKEYANNITDYYFQVHIIEGKQKGSVFNFYSKKIIIGRVGDLIIDDELLSRQHTQISLLGKGVFKVKDLNSSNKTYVNNKEISVSTLTQKDILKIGTTYLKFKYINV